MNLINQGSILMPEGVECTGFYRELVHVSHFEVIAQFIIAALLTFTVANLFNEIFLKKTKSRFWLLTATVLLVVVVVKTLIPLTGFYAEIPHHSYIDCTFNFLIYPSFYGPALDVLFVYNRLFTLLVIPILVLLVAGKILLFSGAKIRKISADK